MRLEHAAGMHLGRLLNPARNRCFYSHWTAARLLVLRPRGLLATFDGNPHLASRTRPHFHHMVCFLRNAMVLGHASASAAALSASV
jgi:hypothetical protein